MQGQTTFDSTQGSAQAPGAFYALSMSNEALSNSMQSVPGRISFYGGRAADARRAFQLAELARKNEEAALYMAAKAELAGAPKAPTEAAIEAHIRTAPHLRARLDAAYQREYDAEHAYEVAKATFAAAKEEANMVAEAARNARAEMAHLDPRIT